MEIVGREFDLAHKYRVRVQVSEERVVPLKFQEQVDDQEVFNTVEEILNRESIEIANEALLQELLLEEQKLIQDLNGNN